MQFKSIIDAVEPFPILGAHYTKDLYTPLDLSITNPLLQSINVSSSEDLRDYIWNHMRVRNAKVAYGGYLERRGIYNRSTHFNKQNSNTERNIHLGLDLWIEADTPVYAPLEGKVHSFKHNKNFGDYGPTLILEHTIKCFKFYSLYGHLSLQSIDTKRVGEFVTKGQQIATLGTAEINGDYPPHLHFQIILYLQGNVGDYPGVSSQKDLEFYKMNCPDPDLILQLV